MIDPPLYDGQGAWQSCTAGNLHYMALAIQEWHSWWHALRGIGMAQQNAILYTKAPHHQVHFSCEARPVHAWMIWVPKSTKCPATVTPRRF